MHSHVTSLHPQATHAQPSSRALRRATPRTTQSFAACVAASTSRLFRSLSAAKAGVADLREELSRAANANRLRGVGTILFVDELHRWSKAQQDALLMDCEKGTVSLQTLKILQPSNPKRHPFNGHR